jgi:hypothetical protein
MAVWRQEMASTEKSEKQQELDVFLSDAFEVWE